MPEERPTQSLLERYAEHAGHRRSGSASPAGGIARRPEGRARELHPPRRRCRRDPGVDGAAHAGTGAGHQLGGHRRQRRLLRHNQVLPQRPARQEPAHTRTSAQGLRRGEHQQCRAPASPPRIRGHRVRARSTTGSTTESVFRAAGQVDLALPHRSQSPLSTRLALPAPLRCWLRCQRLLARRLRAALASSRVPHPPQHRSAEREEPPPPP